MQWILYGNLTTEESIRISNFGEQILNLELKNVSEIIEESIMNVPSESKI